MVRDIRSSDVAAVALKVRAALKLYEVQHGELPQPQPTTRAKDEFLESEGGHSHATMLLPEEDSEVFKRWVLPKLETM